MAAQGGLYDGKPLGRGSFGEVVLKLENDQWIAVKRISLGPNDVQRALEEAQNEVTLMRGLDHERIVKYLRSDMQGNTFCIYMEFMAGGSLSGMLKENGAFDESRSRKYTRQMLEGLAYLHENRVLHRDIKGRNVLCDGKENIKLADFGLSKRIQTLKNISTGNTNQVGTYHWMAPEVIMGTDYGRKADVWSVGATVIEMLTGKPPLYWVEPFAAIIKIGTEKKLEYDLDPNASVEVKNFLESTFKPEADDRPAADELLQHPWLQI